MQIAALRNQYHQALCERNIRIREISAKDKGYPSFSDKSSVESRAIAWGIVDRLSASIAPGDLADQETRRLFERTTQEFIQEALGQLGHLRPGDWTYHVGNSIAQYAQYRHLAELDTIIERRPDLAHLLGGDYLVKPDIVIGRIPISDSVINARDDLLSETGSEARMTPLRAANLTPGTELLHASIACQWTLQNDHRDPRTEALNLIRVRKGNLPHIVAVTAEALPMRIASLALGTGDLDCVYHIALPELRDAVQDLDSEGQTETLETLISGDRLRDISDLPFDLAI